MCLANLFKKEENKMISILFIKGRESDQVVTSKITLPIALYIKEFFSPDVYVHDSEGFRYFEFGPNCMLIAGSGLTIMSDNGDKRLRVF